MKGWRSLAAMAGLGVLLTLTGPAARAAAEPWIVPDDVALALRDPDRFAWQLFVAINWPALDGESAPDPKAALGEPRPVVWETWALTKDVYLPDGQAPPPWPDASSRLGPERDPDEQPLQQTLVRDTRPIPPGTAGHQKDEVRMNRATFDYLRDNGLYSIDGQERRFYAGLPVQFPPGAIEIKAVWRPIGEADKIRYHWATLSDEPDGQERLYGLTSLHVMSKVLPRWLWATFEHVDNPFRRGIHDEGWLIPSRDSVACPPEALDCGRLPAGFGLEDTVWAHYRLRGTQIDFTDDYGQPVQLANSELETGFQRTASCMTCHVRSAIGPRVNAAASFEFGTGYPDHELGPPEATRPPVFKQNEDGSFESYRGAPQPEWFKLPSTGVTSFDSYLQLDYVFSMMRASYASPAAP
ncbi:MAG TPA: hypothetical protein VNS22_02115 [Geminicoccus sp.]|uniref:hypothetical protein n=1 Tax=Geminicoccus sp. TaxID=2024832 RepID=UPI002CB9480C|nr:hypothetical protein [Geminicoccus sp.]HWL67158.1 hypothetical protein [Geminicoccus sp.]